MDGRDTVYDQSYGSFNAIGGGKALAQILMRTHLHTPRDMRLGKILAYRVLEDSIDLAAHGLGKPIRLYTMDVRGFVSEIDKAELDQLERQCELMRELERDALGQLLAPDKEVDTTIPQPEDVAPQP
jgi:hypothetical protein